MVPHLFCYDTGSIQFISQLVLSFDVVFKSFWSRLRFLIEVNTIDGPLLGFLEDSCSGRVFSASVVSVSMSVALKGAR
jgi:hypothetical protein